jgi:hypothetical protein
MQQDNQGRIHTFNQMTPENRAEVVRTHIQRWLDANRSRLTTEQITVMDENIAFVTPGVYALPKTADTIARFKALEMKTKALFTPEEMFQGLTIQGDYIRPKD